MYKLLTIAALILPGALAVSPKVETENVPLERLLGNLEVRSKRNPHDANLLYALAHLHAIIYAQSPATVTINAGTGMLYEGNTPKNLPAIAPGEHSKVHLQKAFYYYNHAGMLGYDRVLADLGMAWCSEQTLATPTDAAPIYRKVFFKAWAREKDQKAFQENGSIALEASRFLLKLLDPSRDAAEINDVKKKVAALEKKVRRAE